MPWSVLARTVSRSQGKVFHITVQLKVCSQVPSARMLREVGPCYPFTAEVALAPHWLPCPIPGLAIGALSEEGSTSRNQKQGLLGGSPPQKQSKVPITASRQNCLEAPTQRPGEQDKEKAAKAAVELRWGSGERFLHKAACPPYLGGTSRTP